MSMRAVTMITKRSPDDHLFDWTKMAWCQTDGTQDIDIVCCFVLLRKYMYLTSVFSTKYAM